MNIYCRRPLLLGCYFLLCLLNTHWAKAQTTEVLANLQGIVVENSRPSWMPVEETTQLNHKDFMALFENGNALTEGRSFQLAMTETDVQGQTRYVYQQYYKGIPVENHVLLLHENEQRVYLVQTNTFKTTANPDPSPILNPQEAFRNALDVARAKTFAWEVPFLEEQLKEITKNPTATHFPTGRLVWVVDQFSKELTLAYKMDIYAVEPIDKKRYYVDAKTGRLVRTVDLLHSNCFNNKIANEKIHFFTKKAISKTIPTHRIKRHTADVEGTGTANYIMQNGGVVNLTTNFDANRYVLATNSLGPLGTQVINTQNANHHWNYNNLTDFEDADNVWDNNPVAVGAHWGAITTYHYFLETFGRNSFDNQGMPVSCVVHYGQDLINAYWDGVQMTFGDGNGNEWAALTSLDIIAHEFMHGVTEHNGIGGLVYMDESGALNESFSDIFGAVVEFLHHPDGGDWWIGEDFDLVNREGFRNMENPNLKNHPKTYLGMHWYDGTGDNGGVHFNSSVQNHWFYLLAAGGNGTNEFGFQYDIQAIGLEKAAAIAYYNLTHYLTPNATFQDAKSGAINAAVVLYPDDASIKERVEMAWCAVGVGTGCGPSIQVNEPLANEIVTAGKNYSIKWTNALISTTSKVKIEYTTDTGNNPRWTFIADKVANTGSYNWAVPSDYSSQVRIRVTDAGDPAIGRVGNSDILGISAVFQIQPCIAHNAFTVPKAGNVQEELTFRANISGDSYAWSINETLLASTANFQHTFEEAGIYDLTLEVVNTANNCVNTETRRLYILDNNSNGFVVKMGDVLKNGGRAYGQGVLATKDGGYIFASLFTAMLVKVDATGQEVWRTQAFPTPAYPNYRMALTEKSDGTILVVMGRSASEGAVMDDNLLLLEIDGLNGTIIGNLGKELAVNGRLLPHQLQLLDDHLVIGGEYETDTGKAIFLLVLDTTDYKILNQYWFGATDRYDYYGDFVPTSDGGYILGWAQTGVYPEHFITVKLNKDFQLEWKQGLASNYVRASSRSRMKIVESPNCGGYLIFAGADEYANTALININTLGNVQWAKRFTVPEAQGQLVAFQDMVWDGKDGVTLLGINGTSNVGLGYPDNVDYQLVNIGFDGIIDWKRKVRDLNVIMPSSVSYNLYVAKLMRAMDGGYIATIPAVAGDEAYLLKTDALGMDGCVLANTQITAEDISDAFTADLTVSTVLATTPSIQSVANYNFSITAPLLAVSAPNCGFVSGSTVRAAFYAEKYKIPVNTAPIIHNISSGATGYEWLVDDQPVSFPLANFSNADTYQLTLKAYNESDTSHLSSTLQVVDESICEIACDLMQETLYPIATTCPDSEDGAINSAVTSAVGRTFYYELYDNKNELLATQTTGYFTNLGAGVYKIVVVSDNDAACFLDLGIITIAPKSDNTPPKTLCLSENVDAAFVHASVGVPYQHLNYTNEMTAALGENWHEMTYEQVDAQKLFSDYYNYIYLEGTDNNANELEAFISGNQQRIENWVAAGNVLLVNAAPNEGDGMNLGFGGIQLIRGRFDSAYVLMPNLPVFNGPLPTLATKFGGYPYALASISCPESVNYTRILVSEMGASGANLLVQTDWGDGKVFLGGMNLTGFHQPSTETYNFKINLHHYLKDLPIATQNTPLQVALTAEDTYHLNLSEIDLGTFDECGLSDINLNKQELMCADIGLVEVVLNAKDIANNEATCTTKIKVIDPSDYCNTVATSNCPTILNLSEMNSEQDTFKAGGIVASGIIDVDTMILFIAADSVVLQAGFQVMPGSEFIARIDTINCENTAAISNKNQLEQPANYRKSNPITSFKNDLKIHPNPFHAVTTIDIILSKASTTDLALFSTDGQLVKSLQQMPLSAGHHTLQLETADLVAGMYILVLQGETFILGRKVVRLK